MGEPSGTNSTCVLDQIGGLNLDQLHELRSAIEKVILNRTAVCINQPKDLMVPQSPGIDFSVARDAGDFVEYSPDRFIDEDTEQLLLAEIKSLSFQAKTRNDVVQNAFIASTAGSYGWTSAKGTVTHKALSIDNFPVIQSIMNNINTQHKYDLNSVLVSYYRCGNVCVRLHDDNEDTMNPQQPICVLSLGVQRKIEFVYKGHASYTTSLSLTPENASLYTMKPGTQEYFRHRVRKDCRVKGERISLSFRCFANKPVATAPEPTEDPGKSASQTLDTLTVPPSERISATTPFRPTRKDNGFTSSTPLFTAAGNDDAGYVPFIGHKDDTAPSSRSMHNNTGTKSNEKLCLIFGSSITEGVVGDMMSRGNRTVVNLSSSGFRIPDVEKAAVDFCEESPELLHRVDKIIINIGTNEIKGFNSFTKSVSRYFRAPLIELVQCLRYHFSNAQLVFQSVLPIRRWYKYNVQSVHLFNHLLIEICQAYGCIFFDCLELFLDGNLHDINWDLFRYSWSGNRFNQGIHLNEKGLGVLCRALKYVVYHNIYNPHPSRLPFNRYYCI